MNAALSMPHSFTLDTNCLIAIDEGRPEAGAIRTLAHAHSLGKADVAVVAISASEKQKSGHYIQNFTEFRDRLASLGLNHLRIIRPMAYFDISFWDYCLLSECAHMGWNRRGESLIAKAPQGHWISSITRSVF
jgi:hypothetical protein